MTTRKRRPDASSAAASPSHPGPDLAPAPSRRPPARPDPTCQAARAAGSPGAAAARAASKLARAAAPPGAVPFRRAKTKHPPATVYRNHAESRNSWREFSLRRLSARESAAKANVAIQPSGDTGSRPHPKWRGPNHTLFPIKGVVRTAVSMVPWDPGLKISLKTWDRRKN
jgi:hypothetical protein